MNEHRFTTIQVHVEVFPPAIRRLLGTGRTGEDVAELLALVPKLPQS